RAWGGHGKLPWAPGVLHGTARGWARDHRAAPGRQRAANSPWGCGDHDVSTLVESLAGLGPWGAPHGRYCPGAASGAGYYVPSQCSVRCAHGATALELSGAHSVSGRSVGRPALSYALLPRASDWGAAHTEEGTGAARLSPRVGVVAAGHPVTRHQ